MSKTREQYSEKLESQFKRLERFYNKSIKYFSGESFSRSSEEVLDDVYSFFLVAYHLREWVKNDGKVSQEIKEKLPTFISDDSRIGLQICRDICNGFKHSNLSEKRNPNDVNIKINQIGDAIFRVPIKELKEINKKGETMHLKAEDAIYIGDFIVSFKGRNYELEGVIKECMYTWNKFFEGNNLLLPRATDKK